MENLLTPTNIIKSNRKTLSLIINNKGELIVRAPLKCRDSAIFDFIKAKAEWIIKKRTITIQNLIKPIEIKTGAKLTLLGKTYDIKLDNVKSVKIIDNTLVVPMQNSKNKLILYLKRTLKRLIEDKIKIINQTYDFKYNNISISSAKTNWGSCSGTNNLHFTYKLMLCPEQVVDYIIIHELVHTVIKNHSKTYWRNVKKIYPYYKQCEYWLKENKGIVELI